MTDSLAGKTLLQVIPKLKGGGAERTTLEVGAAFAAAGGRSIVVSSGGGMVDELEQHSEHITMPVESKNPWLIAQNAKDLAEIIARDEVSILHARSRAPAWSCLSAAKRTGVPYVTTFHGHYKAKSGLKRLYNSVMVRADRVIANSAFTGAHIRKEFAGRKYFDPSRLVTIQRGADVRVFDPSAVSEDRRRVWEARFGTGLKIALPGRFTEWKGQRGLVEARTLLKQSHPQIEVSALLVGRMDEKPAYVDELRGLIRDNGVGDTAQLLPVTDDVAALLAASDVVLSTSTEPEAFGRVAVEGMAAARPVIASAHGGALETIKDEETGLLVAPGDAEALASALTKLHDCGEVGRSEMGRRGMVHAQSTLSTEVMTTLVLNVYRDLLEQAGG